MNFYVTYIIINHHKLLLHMNIGLMSKTCVITNMLVIQNS